MAEQLELSLSDGVLHRSLPLQLSSDFIVGDVVLPVDFQYVSVTSHLVTSLLLKEYLPTYHLFLLTSMSVRLSFGKKISPLMSP